MPTLEEDKRKLRALKNQLTVFSLFGDDFHFSKREKEIATDIILDEMIILLKRIRKYEQADENEQKNTNV